MIIESLKALWQTCKALIVAGVTTGIVGGIVLAGINSYVGFVAHQRAIVESEFTTLRGTSSELYQLLDAYALKARTGARVDEDTARRFRQTVLKAHDQAADIARREPRAKDEFAEFAKALISLREASEFKGPLDAQRFVEAASRYLDAKSKLDKKITTLQGSFVSAMFGA